jgi:amidase
MDRTDEGMDRRAFLGASLAGTAALASPRPPKGAERPSLEDATLDALRKGMESGALTCRSITRHYLARVEALDRRGPRINAVIELNPDALALAEALDQERKRQGPRGPLHGIPVLLKDNLDTADRMATTAGSLALLGARRPPADAFVVERLRAAGALILGKTNLSEWANLRSTHSVSGWSGRGGLTRNPHALDRNTSGSSSGSAAAVAAGLCAAAVGTETDGSIVSPSSVCGIVGLKPTVGLLSRTGIIPLSHTQDTAGPMARTVRDAALLLGAMAGEDPQDPATREAKGKLHGDYASFLDSQALRGARLGVVRNLFGDNIHVHRVMEAALQALASRGAVLVDNLDLSTREYEEAELEVLLYEFKADYQAYMARREPGGGPLGSLAGVIAFNEAHRDKEMPYFAQELLLRAQAKGPLTEEGYVKALDLCRARSRSTLDGLLEGHRLDALVAPTGGPAWTTDLVNGDHSGFSCSTPAAVAGYPHLTVPAGFVFGLPVGLSFFGRPWQEGRLLALGHAFERATGHRRPPRFPATLRT